MEKINNTDKKHSNSFLFNVFLILLFLLCIAPTSINSDFSKISILYNITNLFLVLLFGFSYGALSKKAFISVFFILFLYTSFTIFSTFLDYNFGHIFSILPILTLTCFRFKRLPFSNLIFFIYYSVVVFVFIVGYLSYFFPAMIDLYKSYYSYGYEELLYYMLIEGKPVSIFATHTLSSFFYFLFYILSWHLIINKKNKWFNVFVIIISLISLILTNSGSSRFFLIMIMMFLGVYQVSSKRNFNGFYGIRFVFLVFAVCMVSILFGKETIEDMIEGILGDSGNGAISRYTGGVLEKTIEYVLNNPIFGIGLAYNEDLYYSDSDYIVTALRLGIPGAFIYFLSIFIFLINSIKNRSDIVLVIFLLLGILFFMLAMPISNYVRTVPFLILTILLFNAGDKLSHMNKDLKKNY